MLEPPKPRPVNDERALWLARHILPNEQKLRAWLQKRQLEGVEIDDVVQEVWTRLSAAESIEHIRNPMGYAFQIASSILTDHVRRKKVVSISSVGDFDFLGDAAASDEPSPEEFVAGREELQRLADGIASLPGKVREVFIMLRIQGLTHREAAERLGVTQSTVEKHVAKGLRLMLEHLGRGGTGGARPSRDTNRRLQASDGARDGQPD